ncbi:uncharacterized protein METZ01_LOCUS385776, partial [marine metagenome]
VSGVYECFGTFLLSTADTSNFPIIFMTNQYFMRHPAGLRGWVSRTNGDL